jgi:prepilin-type N-terminal cleavage/methylation domain-containing protein/prepilin-type processing-associated H-X9-DG protein
MSTQTVSRRTCVPRLSGFTLIEVLVVVAIIALLISILLPSLKVAREQARNVACGSNLNQTGNAVLFYAQAQKDFFPGAGSWPELIGPYVHKERRGSMTNIDRALGTGEHLARVDTYMCPNDEEYITSGMVYKTLPSGEKIRALYALSYGMNSYVPYPLSNPEAARKGTDFSAYNVKPGITTGADGMTRVFNNLNKTTTITRHSDIVMVTDAGQDDLWVTRYADLAWDFDPQRDDPGNASNLGLLEVHHRTGNNFIFADGHVEFKKILRGIFMEGVPVFPGHWIPINGITGAPPRATGGFAGG